MKYIWMILLVLMPSVGFAQFPDWLKGPGPVLFYITVPGGGATPCKVDFEDFIAFAQSFEARIGDSHYNPLADTNQDGVVNFPDFIAFASVYGLTEVNGGCVP